MAADLIYVNTGVLSDGVCDCIYNAVLMIDSKSAPLRAHILNYFPEILKYKPKNKSSYDLWWKIDKTGTRKRFKMVLDVILKLS